MWGKSRSIQCFPKPIARSAKMMADGCCIETGIDANKENFEIRSNQVRNCSIRCSRDLFTGWFAHVFHRILQVRNQREILLRSPRPVGHCTVIEDLAYLSSEGSTSFEPVQFADEAIEMGDIHSRSLERERRSDSFRQAHRVPSPSSASAG